MSIEKSKQFRRYLSDEGYKNYSYVFDEEEKQWQKKSSEMPQSKKQFIPGAVISRISSTENDYRKHTRLRETLNGSPIVAATKIQLENENVYFNQSSPGIIENTSIEKGFYKKSKSSSQRWRWNLIFNLLVWIIVPLPFWVPYITYKVASYMLVSIQAVFVFMWMSTY